MKEFVFGSFIYQYELIKQDRKTLSLTVMPDLKIILKVPRSVEHERIDTFLKKKWFWLEKQLRFFKKYQRKVYKKEYISGEGFLYLGKQYTLKVRRGAQEKVVLDREKIIVTHSGLVSDSKYTKKVLEGWYLKKTEEVFNHRHEYVQKKFDYSDFPKLGIRDMKKRWGSFLGKNKILLNPKLIHVPIECIDYVITHELCHMKFKNHDKGFWKLLEQKCPKWEKIKEKLETYY
jgi:predicted metal-dependent hydrolase